MGVRFISINDKYDSENPNSVGDIISVFKTMLYDFYSKDLSKKIKSAKINKALNGEYINSRAAFGYVKSKKNRNTLEIDEGAATTIRYIFENFIDGKRKIDIARELNDVNIQTPAQYMEDKNNIIIGGKSKNKNTKALLTLGGGENAKLWCGTRDFTNKFNCENVVIYKEDLCNIVLKEIKEQMNILVEMKKIISLKREKEKHTINLKLNKLTETERKLNRLNIESRNLFEKMVTGKIEKTLYKNESIILSNKQNEMEKDLSELKLVIQILKDTSLVSKLDSYI